MVSRFPRPALAALALVCACSSTTTPPATGIVSAAVDVAGIKNDGTKANVTATARDAQGKPGTGTITFSAPYGDMNATGKSTATVTLDATGVAKVTYACDVAKDASCVAAAVLISAVWNGLSGGTAVSVTSAVAGGGAGGGTGGGGGGGTGGGTGGTSIASKIVSVSTVPGYVIVSGAANNVDLPGTATATFKVTDQSGAAFAGATVAFAEQVGESLVTLGAASAVSDASGNVTVTITGKATVGIAHVDATISGAVPATITVPVLGGPTAIDQVSSTPPVLGLKGSGIQEHGQMTFLVSDPMGTPVPGVRVNFTETQPLLVTLIGTSATTGTDGKVLVSYAAGAEAGVTSILATVVATGATGSHPVAVRGAKPSASGFYFSCAKANLPVYTSTPRFESTTCTVRLSDRFGNRVGISTPVRFASEAGTIDSVALTKPFNFNNPNDPDEGSAIVTFSSDMGNGIYPADVQPLAAAPGQYPWPRLAEPQVASGLLTLNPRDQLVTIIAMTEGEEAFVDANHNGVLDNNEVFYDLGDPYIDANDDGVYDQATPNGLWEVRFCGINPDCSVYRGPNGQWDSLTTIWAPTWVVFSAPGVPQTAPAGGVAPAPSYSPGCVNSKAAAFADIYVYDHFLNSPASGTTYGSAAIESTTTASPSLTIKTHGFLTELDQWGAMGMLHFDFDYLPVLANGSACAAPASPAAPTPCVMRMLFRDFDSGFRGTLELDNASPTLGCPSSNLVTTSIQATNAHGVITKGIQGNGTTYAP